MGHNFEELLYEFHRLSPKAQLVGCTGSGVIGREGPNETMRALAVMAVRGPKEEFAVAGVDSIVDVDTHDVCVRIARDLKNANPRINMIHFLPASRYILPADRAIEGFESVFGPDVPIFGGCALDTTRFFSSYQFMGDRIIEQGAVAVGFADPTLDIVMRADHGYTVFGEPFTVTGSESNRVYALDGRNPWKALTERVNLPQTVEPMSPEAAATVSIAWKLPKALHDEYGSPYTIWLGGPFKDEEGCLYTWAACPVGTKIWLTRREEENVFRGVDRIARRIKALGGERLPVAVFHADCSARGKRLFNRYLKEELVSRMQYPLCGDEEIPWAGFYSGGEFCTIGSRNMFYGWTTALFVLYRREG